ncbi:glycoside hydrolase family 9 protein [Nesterenkonia sp. LB17]|uniref:glycoside hydrolase family 9 protein n=1 Tax=Nesterenkonia sp. LB17 TaxID=2901230 RepID=UPI001F4CC30F|nr:glycoside hydrolase family 9 protein [Nesterenkonia sp. LB17]MCH8566280.1 glycoside hydrolase family 9 protein [Nesterenkonia sp. LB17]
MHPRSTQRVGFLPARGAATLAVAVLALLGCASENTHADEGSTSSNDESAAASFGHETGPRVRVNQLGYLPDGPKRATLVSDQTEAVSWQLLDDDGGLAAQGESTPQGFDPSAGLDVHTIDFSDHGDSGAGYTLTAEGEQSYPFDITEDLYTPLRHDALNVYYTHRSGIAIEPIEVDGSLERQEYERPAGHVTEFVPPWEDLPDADVPNRGDLQVPCLPAERFVWNGAEQHASADVYGDPEAWRCPEGYALDAAGGWYDAGDHGKYVVNSGISVWQLLATYERSQNAEVTVDEALGDETLLIPERGNEVPDILDEARWNLEWMLSMQVPADTWMTIDGVEIDAGGMAHHKLHDIAWTGMDTLPHEDPMPRYLHRPSTAATLNLAAAAAHGARLYDQYDEEFADELLDAAESAWAAAAEHSSIFRGPDGVDPNPGGGPYNDHEFSDEFYWAAAQLYLTTGSASYEDAVRTNVHHVGGAEDQVFGTPAFDWKNTAAAARLDLATVDSDLEDREAVIDSVVDAADAYLAVQQDQPFGHPYAPEEYDWGSNHMVLNNAAVIATAFDLTGETRYREAGIEAIDYVLGRNAINNSYVSGYGTYFSENMHSRWYAADHERLPPFPAGKLAGGANSVLGDPTAQGDLSGCAPQFCYIDASDSWSTNETTINWNAALAWHASWLDDMGRAG